MYENKLQLQLQWMIYCHVVTLHNNRLYIVWNQSRILYGNEIIQKRTL